jgi:hypothetical protein
MGTLKSHQEGDAKDSKGHVMMHRGQEILKKHFLEDDVP